MDPNVTLSLIDTFASQGDRVAARSAAFVLHEWIGSGGFAPEWDKHPRGTKFYKQTTGFLSPKDMK